MNNRPALLALAAAVLLSTELLAADHPEKPTASNYHFIGAFSRDELRVMEMLALAQRAAQPTPAARIALPAGARALQGSPGVSLVGGELVVDFSRTGEDQLVTWSYLLPLTSRTMVLERVLPLVTTRAMVVLQSAGPDLEVTWPKGAELVTPLEREPRNITASARDIPAGSPIVITISGVPDLTRRSSPTWLLWIVLAMAGATALAVALCALRGSSAP